MEGGEPFSRKGFSPLQTTPFSQKLLNKQIRGRVPLNSAHVLVFVQTLPRWKWLVESFYAVLSGCYFRKKFLDYYVNQSIPSACHHPSHAFQLSVRKRGRGPRFLRELLFCLRTTAKTLARQTTEQRTAPNKQTKAPNENESC